MSMSMFKRRHHPRDARTRLAHSISAPIYESYSTRSKGNHGRPFSTGSRDQLDSFHRDNAILVDDASSVAVDSIYPGHGSALSRLPFSEAVFLLHLTEGANADTEDRLDQIQW